MKCRRTGKKSHLSKEAAEEALLQARIQFPSNTAVNVYQCEVCDEWHLTSQGEINPKLKQAIEDGSLKKEIARYEWNERYGRR